MTPAVEVVVVGAGLAGLYAARSLRRAGLEVRVLEARDRVGGRAWSRSIGGGASIDLRAQWIGPGQPRMQALARELGLATVRTHTAGDINFAGGDPSIQVSNPNARYDVDIAGPGSVFGYDFDAFAGNLALGTFNPGETFTLTYVMTATASAPGRETGAAASIGDPFDLTAGPGVSGAISSTPGGPTPVPEPGTLGLLGSALLGLVATGRRKRIARRR